jgi:protein tyrosine/serine phosphatase
MIFAWMCRRSLIGGLAVILGTGAAAGGWAGWLRLTGNIHEIEPGIYRSAQLSPERLSAFVQAHHIKTVLNLRGESPGSRWYDAEVDAVHRTSAQLITVRMSANHEPDPATLMALVETLRSAPTPLLLHCNGGADRSGLAAALYELTVMHRPEAIADTQLSFRYGHFPWLTSHTGAMDRTFEQIAATSPYDLNRVIQ